MPRNKERCVRRCLAIFILMVLWLASGNLQELSAGDEETYKGLKIFSDVIDLIEKNYVDPVDSKDLIQKAIQGMVGSLDPHSQLLPPEAFEELQIDTRGEFGGIGIVITMQKGFLTVISPIEGTPAYKAGIKAGDIIIKVDGESTKDMMLWEAVKKMRGPKGESVEITVFREGETDPMDFTLVRDIIPIESVRYMALQPGYGYIRITNFQENTTDDLNAALKAMEQGKTPMKGLVLDLRDNPGGLLNQAVDVSDVFLDAGNIVSIKGRLEKHTKIFDAKPNRLKRAYPIVVLINGGSASASEIVAGALQDHHRAVILGTTSFGKGSVQTVESLRDGYGLKFTIARYYTPSGRSIQAQGIVPDIEVKPQVIEEEAGGESEQMLKERDLKNHLGAEPFPPAAPEPGDKQKKEKDPADDRKSDTRYGPIDVKGLQSDNQVMRALEILKGYQILTEARS
ncbi:S41 family peptidase [Desulfococcus sp.]|uniref:S41 family peptidase n=1 Tax=Desulfococcus sp. TaxID=2025834 RepID=UPI003593A28D